MTVWPVAVPPSPKFHWIVVAVPAGSPLVSICAVKVTGCPAVPVNGPFNVIRAAFEALTESGDGRIVVISSASAETGLPGQVVRPA